MTLEERVVKIERFLYKFYIERCDDSKSTEEQYKIIDECREIVESFKDVKT